jgi:C_GCAxxG_C_C family probable redox protein
MNQAEQNQTEQAVGYFKGGYACSQAIAATFAPSLGLDREAAMKIASGFGAGMGRMAETCGAVTGAYIVLGLRFGTATTGPETRESVYSRVRQFAERFKACNGSLVCRELLGCDLSTPDGAAEARDKGLFVTLCPKYVETAAKILEEMLE